MQSESPGGVLFSIHRGLSADASETSVLKAREFRLPTGQFAIASIVTGPNRNLWFTEWRHIVQMDVNGHLTEAHLCNWQSIPGAITNGPDGNVWVNSATFYNGKKGICHQKWGGTAYQIFKVTPDMHLTTYFLPSDTFAMPSDLVRIDSSLYTGTTTFHEVHGGDVVGHVVNRVTLDGTLSKVFAVHYPKYFEGPDWIRALATPDKKIWLYNYVGGLHGCQLDGHCSYTLLGDPYLYVESLQGTLTAYSPADQNVYVCNTNTQSIYKVSLSGKRQPTYRNADIGFGFCAMTYYRHDIWVTMGGDSQGRPMLGRLSPSGAFNELSLPFPGPAGVTAMTEGPDGNLWYLRGRNVGEILSTP